MSTWVISGRTVSSSRTCSAIAFRVKTSVAPEMAMSVTWFPRDELADDRPFRLDGERGDGVDLVLDLVDDPAGVGTELELDHDQGAALGRRRLDLLDAVDALDGLLDAEYDP